MAVTLNMRQSHEVIKWMEVNIKHFEGRTYEEVADRCTKAMGFEVSFRTIRSLAHQMGMKWTGAKQREASKEMLNAMADKMKELDARIYRIESDLYSLKPRTELGGKK